jgi:hypothetical protein
MSVAYLDHAKFKEAMVRSLPVVVTDLGDTIQGNWTPAYFRDFFGSETVTIVNCNTDAEYESTVAEFFDSFGTTRSRESDMPVLKLKVRPRCYCSCIRAAESRFRIGPPNTTSTKSFRSCMLPS